MKPRLLALLFTPLLAGQATPPEPQAEQSTIIELETDRRDRMTVPVSIEGKGPYRFIVDTGSERTVIARELARELQLGSGTTAQVHSVTEVSKIGTVIIPALEVGGREVRRIHAPALERRNLGAEGILGVDTLQSQRVSFDFVRQVMTVTPSRKREEAWPSDTIVVTARNRFGHLVLVDASIDGQKVWVIVDTGAEITLANNALRRRLQRKNRLGPVYPISILSVTGGSLMADQTAAKKVRLGGVEINNMPIAFADVHPFRKLGLMDRPAILLGMDVLRLFDRVSVDFANRRVRLLGPESSERSERTRYASAR